MPRQLSFGSGGISGTNGSASFLYRSPVVQKANNFSDMITLQVWREILIIVWRQPWRPCEHRMVRKLHKHVACYWHRERRFRSIWHCKLLPRDQTRCVDRWANRETFSMNRFSRSGNSAALQTARFSPKSGKYGFDLIDNLLVVFGPDSTTAMYSYWTVEITPGSNAASDTFTISSATAVNSDTGICRSLHIVNQDGFLVWTQPSSGPANVPRRIARTTTNANKLTSLSGRNYIGFASNSASAVEVIAIAILRRHSTQGSLSTNTLYYVKNDGSIKHPLRMAMQDAL